MKERGIVLISGGQTTKGLTEHLIKDYDVAIVDSGIGESQFQKYGTRIIPIQRLVDAETQQIAANEAARICASSLNLEATHRRLKDIDPAFDDVDVSAWLPGYMVANFTQQIIATLTLDKIRDRLLLCILHEDVTQLYGGVARWAKARGIKTMHVPHANPFMLDTHGPDVHWESVCDYLAGTRYMHEWYKARGYAGEMRVTGSPLFDRWKGFVKDRDHCRRVLKVDGTVVVYMSSWSQTTNHRDDLSRFGETLEAVFDGATDYRLVVKLHPGEPPEIEKQYAARAAEYGIKCVVTRHYLEIVLSAADLVLTLGPSNVLVDAAVIDVPSISVRMPGYSIQHPAVLEIEPGEIRDTIRKYDRTVWDTNRADLVAQCAGDGQATYYVADWVKEICQSSSK